MVSQRVMIIWKLLNITLFMKYMELENFNIYIFQNAELIRLLSKNCSKTIIVGCCEGRVVENFEVQMYTLFQKYRYFNHLNHLKALMNESDIQAYR